MESELRTLDNFQPKSISEILWMGDEIIKSVRDNPSEDKIFMVPLYDNVLEEQDYDKDDIKYCIAGSSAVTLFAKLLKVQQFRLKKSSSKIGNYNIKGEFVSNDTDIFFLGSKSQHRKQCGNVDIVHLKENSVESLLLNFDLGCCRAAINDNCDAEVGWISAHCIASLLTGEYFLPSYLKNSEDFLKIFSGSAKLLLKETKELTETSLVDKLFKRLTFRLAKYENRGYNCIYYETDKPLRWIKHRFFYGELLLKA